MIVIGEEVEVVTRIMIVEIVVEIVVVVGEVRVEVVRIRLEVIGNYYLPSLQPRIDNTTILKLGNEILIYINIV